MNQHSTSFKSRPLSAPRLGLRLALALALPLAVHGVQAQSLEGAIRQALVDYPGIKAGQQNVNSAKAEIDRADGARMPTLSLNASGNKIKDSSLDQKPMATPWLAWSVPINGRAQAEMERTENAAKAAQAKLQVTRDDVALQVSEAWLAVVRGQQMVQLAQQNVTEHASILGDIQKIVAIDAGRSLDVSQAQVRLDAARHNLAQRQNELTQAQQRLSRFSADAKQGAAFSRYPELPKSVPGDETQALAALNSPALAQARAQQEEAQARVRAAKAQHNPTLDLTMGRQYMGFASGSHTVAAATFSLPLYRGGQIEAAVRSAVAQAMAAQDTLAETELVVKERIRLAYADLANAQTRLSIASQQRDSGATLTGLGGQTYTATVMPGVNGGPNTFSIPVTGADMAAIADGSLTPQVSVTNIFGLSGTDTEPLRIDTTAPSAPTVALPESASGVNAAEAASNGGTPLVVTLPQNAVAGDTVTSVVTKADGSTLLLSRVLTAADITAGNITQLISTAQLNVDGPWSTSTTITDTAGNTSAPQSGGFVLDTEAPGAPGVSLPESPYAVNAAEAANVGGTPLDISLPGNAAVGDVVTTTVTLPNGSTRTLSSVLTAADLAAGTVTQVIPTADLTVDGTWSTSTTVTDLAGNTGPARTRSFVLDTTPPAAPVADVAATSDTGASNTDNNTSDNTPTISGTGTAGDTITVTFPTGEVQTAVVAANGTWSVTPATALLDGAQTVLVTATDPAGNTSPASQVALVIDTTAPVAPTIDLADASDTGSSNTDNVTGDNTPTLRGTGVPGDTIRVYNAQGQVVATAVVDGNGNWAATASTLTDGVNNLVAKATDTAGNEGPGAPLAVTVDTAAPAAPVADVATASDSGSSNTDNLTNDTTPTISGTGTNGDTITVTFPGGEVKTAVVVNGVWSVTPVNPLAEGLNNVSVTATDPAGNTSPATTVPVTIDTVGPAAPAADVVATSDTGASNTDNNTSDNTPTISGTGTNGDTITVAFPSGEVKTAVVVNGVWSVTPDTALLHGAHNVSVTATDPAGNISPATTVPVVIDTTAPAAPTVNALSTNDSTPVLTGTAALGVGETLQVSVNGATYNVTVGVGGIWSLDTGTAPIASGSLGSFVSGVSYPVTATVTDAAGNTTSDATTAELSFNNAAPTVPTVNPLVTNDTTPVITGVANLVNGETLTVQVNGALYNVTVGAGGVWSVDTGSAVPANGTVLAAFVDGHGRALRL